MGTWSSFNNGVVPLNVIVDNTGTVRFKGVGYNESAILQVLDELLSASDTTPRPGPRTFEIRTFPNPFNPATSIRFELPRSEPVELLVRDATGALIYEFDAGVLNAGDQTLSWQGRSNEGVQASSGIYFIQVRTNTLQGSMKVLLLK